MMKNATFYYLFICLLVLVTNCSNETIAVNPESEPPNNSEVLTSIVINSTWINFLEVINFDNNEITDVQFSDGTSHLYFYEDGKVSSVEEYDATGSILFTKTFTYDSSDKLVAKQVIPNTSLTQWETYTSYEYTYSDNLILVTFKEFDFNDIQIGEDQLQYLDIDQNNIVRSYNQDFYNFRGEASYIGNNPISFQQYFSGNIFENSSYNYLNMIAADAYSINKFKFGNEWKINTLLAIENSSSAIGTFTLDDISTNYLEKITSNLILADGSQSTSIVDYAYEFDDQNLLLSQTNTSTSTNTNETYVTLITYEYE